MEPDVAIQMLRTCSMLQLRKQLEKMAAKNDPDYEVVCNFIIAVSNQDPHDS